MSKIADPASAGERIAKAIRAIGARLTPVPIGCLELPEAHGDAVFDRLEKAAGHKYIKRVPTGKTTKTGKPRYRYFYHVAAGGGVGAHEHMVAGASFRADGGHWHIEHADGERLRVKHDETGESRQMTRGELSQKLQGEHRSALAAHTERLERERAEVKQFGSAKQKERLGVKEDPPAQTKPAAAKVNEEHVFADDPASNAHLPGSIYRNGEGGKHYVSLKVSSRKGRESDEDIGMYGTVGKTVHTVTSREATPEEAERYDAWKQKRDAAQEHLKANEFGTTNPVDATLATEDARHREFRTTGKEHPPGQGERIQIKPPDKWGRQGRHVSIDKDGGKITYEVNHDQYDDPRGNAVYVHPYSDELAASIRTHAAQHYQKTSEARGALSELRPKVDVPRETKPPAEGSPRASGSSQAAAAGAQLQYRKTRDGDWAVFGPARHVQSGRHHTVTKRDGTTKTEFVHAVSRPFDVNGVPHVYGFLQKASPDTISRWVSAWALLKARV